jgi:hypothetical protein
LFIMRRQSLKVRERCGDVLHGDETGETHERGWERECDLYHATIRQFPPDCEGSSLRIVSNSDLPFTVKSCNFPHWLVHETNINVIYTNQNDM